MWRRKIKKNKTKNGYCYAHKSQAPDYVKPKKTIKLFRFTSGDSINENDLKPETVINPKRKIPEGKKCMSWGLSHYNTKESAISAFNTLAKRKKAKGIYSIEITEEMAIKHQSGASKNHYTVYPYEDVNLIDNFVKEEL